MDLSELNKMAKAEDVEEADESDEVEDSVEADLTDALDYIEQLVLMMEEITIKASRNQIINIPDGMIELMEEASEWMEQFEPEDEKEDKNETEFGGFV